MNSAVVADLLLLALVQRGLHTPYDLNVRAGLSVGTTTPVLARLEKGGWIEADEMGVRRSRRFSITKSGERRLKSEWKSLLGGRQTTTDEILRIVYLSRVLGNASTAAEFAARASGDLAALGEMKQMEAHQHNSGPDSPTSADWYLSMKLRSQAADAQAHARLLAEIAKELQPSNRSKKKR
jgi:DNA-binding MarR family transcriptional regulator